MKISLLCLTALLSLSGCTLVNEATHGHDDVGSWKGSTSFTSADVRTITRRTRPGSGTEVVCTEPTPDVAKALSTALQTSAKVNTGKLGVDTGLSQNTAEALAELGGRSTALLALRDGLFRTCEAYANGSIGSAAYTLVLSRYGQLMTTLFLAEDVRGVVRKNLAAMSSPPLKISSDGADKPSPSPAPNGAQSPTPGTLPATAILTLGRMNEDYFSLDTDIVPQLMIACINEFDPTVVGRGGTNDWLRGFCNQFAATPATLADTLAKMLALQQKVGRPAPLIDPAVAVSNSGASPGNASKDTAAPRATTASKAASEHKKPT
jgi:hypothetical protein